MFFFPLCLNLLYPNPSFSFENTPSAWILPFILSFIPSFGSNFLIISFWSFFLSFLNISYILILSTMFWPGCTFPSSCIYCSIFRFNLSCIIFGAMIYFVSNICFLIITLYHKKHAVSCVLFLLAIFCNSPIHFLINLSSTNYDNYFDISRTFQKEKYFIEFT